ncbi:DUF4163 domain-containing protein [Aurantiacibacter aquimixticola]|uniref:DUF4163 domain-containing protein n=1 Tax=Aurantiacibacter aquimixticola TaxID=1958945 RepID=A0A419RT95_9SPHN|nr:DUF4163 domain-containing protein [Aurantiacibacter aquimixticola]RJY09022.1 DUF4163 domain-containing protein [Aurantiacibacter aquimixticola]
MKRRLTWVLVPALTLSACDMLAGEEQTPAPPPATPLASASASTSAPIGGARQVSEETDTFLFEYAYPQEAGEVEGLAAWLDGNLDTQRNALAREAERARRDARSNGFPFNKYSSNTAWAVVADLPKWLSLSAENDIYMGGAHPNYGFDAVVWDKEQGKRLEPAAFFTSLDALDNALGTRLCEALNAEREQRRGVPVAEGSDDDFDACVPAEETTLLLGSSGGRAFDRIGVQIAPYVAGPYAEGSYDFSFDVDDAVLAAVKPEYREAFAARD